jgi:predicted nucleotidyltransferase
MTQLTPHADVNAIIELLLESIRAVLGDQIVGMYLDGSLASGDFDEDSDIDFVVVTERAVTKEQFETLQAMHDRIATLDTPWAIQLEGSYIDRESIRRHDPQRTVHPNIERGKGERLKLVEHGLGWFDVHRFVLRERGIVVTGPTPDTFIDPVQPDQLRNAMLSLLKGWAQSILDQPERIQHRGYQSYIVLSMCRVLYTLEHGAIVSKHTAARWVQQTLDPRWNDLIERAWEGRHNPDWALPPDGDDMNGTVELIRYTMERSEQYGST